MSLLITFLNFFLNPFGLALKGRETVCAPALTCRSPQPFFGGGVLILLFVFISPACAQNAHGFFTFFPGPTLHLPPTFQKQQDFPLDRAIAAYKAQDYLKALALFEKASQSGDLVASWNLGNMYYRGTGIAINLKKALFYYGMVIASYEEMQANKKIFMIILDSFVQMADIYRCGGSADPDLKNLRKALDFYSIAAGYGHPSAFYGMGLLYHSGEKGFEKRRTQGLFWIRKAALKGYLPAQFFLGDFYFSHATDSKNRIEAIAWYRIAQKKTKDHYPQDRLRLLLSKATEEEKKKSQDLMTSWRIGEGL